MFIAGRALPARAGVIVMALEHKQAGVPWTLHWRQCDVLAIKDDRTRHSGVRSSRSLV